MWPHPVGLGPFGERLDRLRSGLGRRWAARCRHRWPRAGEWRSSTLALDRSTRGSARSWAEREAGRGGVDGRRKLLGGSLLHEQREQVREGGGKEEERERQGRGR